MKRVSCALFSIIMLISSISFANRPMEQSELKLPFSLFNDQSVSILFKLDTGQAIMMIPFSDFGFGDDELIYMANAVQEMVSSKKQVPLANGYTIEFGTGFPIWGPYREIGPNYKYKCLFFGENTTIYGKRIIVDGRSDPSPYNGYSLWLKKK